MTLSMHRTPFVRSGKNYLHRIEKNWSKQSIVLLKPNPTYWAGSQRRYDRESGKRGWAPELGTEGKHDCRGWHFAFGYIFAYTCFLTKDEASFHIYKRGRMHIVYEYQLEYLINKRSKVKVSIIKNTFVRRLSYAFVRRCYTFVTLILRLP